MDIENRRLVEWRPCDITRSMCQHTVLFVVVVVVCFNSAENNESLNSIHTVQRPFGSKDQMKLFP